MRCKNCGEEMPFDTDNEGLYWQEQGVCGEACAEMLADFVAEEKKKEHQTREINRKVAAGWLPDHIEDHTGGLK